MFAEHLRDGPAASRATRQGRNAESAVVIAAILRLDEGTGAQTPPRDRLSAGSLTIQRLRIEIRDGNLQQTGHQAVFLEVGDDLEHTWQRGRLSGMEGGPTAGNGDLGDPLAFELANFLARIRDRSGSDRTGIDHSQVGLRGAGDQSVPGETELAGILLNFGLVQTTADGIQINLHGW